MKHTAKLFRLFIIAALLAATPLAFAAMARADEAMTWQSLQVAINNVDKVGTVTLTGNVTATAADGPLVIPEGKTISLQMGNYTLDRHLSEPEEMGGVLLVNGNLAIRGDGAAKITGGNTLDAGGGLYIGSDASVSVYGCEITGNYAGDVGGGVAVMGGAFMLNGGRITDNHAESAGGAVYVSEGRCVMTSTVRVTGNTSGFVGGGVAVFNDSTFSVRDDTEITGNRRMGHVDEDERDDDDIYLGEGTVIRLGGAVTGKGPWYVTTGARPDDAHSVPLTDNLKGNATTDLIACTRAEDTIVLNTYSGEAALATRMVELSIEAGDGSGATHTYQVPCGSEVTLPDPFGAPYNYTAPADTYFNGWRKQTVGQGADDQAYQPGDKATVTGETVFAPMWAYSWAALQRKLNEGGKIVLQGDVTATAEDTVLTIPGGKPVDLDLNGYTIDRGLTMSTDGGNVIISHSDLTIRDSSKGQTGKITGGATSSNGVIYVYGTFRLYGGNITGNKCTWAFSSIVKMGSDANFEMYGGSISGNSAYSSVIDTGIGGDFTMYGGSVSDNDATISMISISPSSNFYMYGGTIARNREGSSGGTQTGAISLAYATSSAHLYGGEIVDNHGDNSGGIYCEGGNLYLSGAPLIQGNTYDNGNGVKRGDVCIKNGKIIVSEALNAGTRIGIADPHGLAKPVTVTAPLDGKANLSNFYSQDGYTLGLNARGEVVMGNGTTLTYDAMGGTGSMTGETLVAGAEKEMPACGFTAPSGKHFVGWELDDGKIYLAGEAAKVGVNARAKAVWAATDWEDLQLRLNAGATRAFTLTKDLKALSSEAALTVSEGLEAVIDLNGHTVDRAREDAEANGSAFIVKGKLTLRDTSAQKTGKVTGGKSKTSGGGILSTGTLTIEGGAFTGNHSDGDGGAVYASGSLTVSGGSFTGNDADGSGGAVGCEGALAVSGGEFSDNSAQNAGGALYCGGTATISGGTFTGNSARDGGAIIASGKEALELADGAFTGNRATDNGGALYILSGTTAAVKDGTFVNNTAGKNGGAIANNGELTISKGEFTGNVAANGGAFSNAAGKTAKIDGGSFSGNTAPNGAGGAVHNAGTLTVNAGTFSGGSAREAGAVYNADSGSFTLNGGSINGNKAAVYGGGAVENYGEMRMTGGSVTGNKAQMNGAGIWTAGSLTVTGGEIKGNACLTSTGNGGGIYFRSGTLAFSGKPQVTGNTSNNVNVLSGQKITFEGALDSAARIGVRVEGSEAHRIFTNGLAGNGSVQNFISDDDTCDIALTEAGEAQVAGGIVLRFDANGGSGSMSNVDVRSGQAYTLPKCDFTAPEGKLFAGWTIDGVYYAAGESVVLRAFTTAKAMWAVNGWDALQQRIDLNDGRTIKLTEDVRAQGGQKALTLKDDRNVTIDLNGHTIDRGLAQPEYYGGVFYLNDDASLTLRDSSAGQTGVITGGNTRTKGGGVEMYGDSALYMYGGTITGNTAERGGGVAPIYFHMYGGRIVGNTAAEYGGGVLQSSKDLFISGGATIIDNHTSGGDDDNVRLSSHTTSTGDDVHIMIVLEGALDAKARIGVNFRQAYGHSHLFTRNVRQYAAPENFRADESGQEIRRNADGELELGTPATLRFEPGDGASGAMAPISVWNDQQVTMPECAFTGPAGQPFYCWLLDTGVSCEAGEAIVPGRDAVVTPLWTDSDWNALQTRLTLGGGGTVRLNRDVTAGSADKALVIPEGCKATLDLNGHTVDRALKQPVADGSVFIVRGDLTITDSSAGGRGAITGGKTTTSGGGVRVNKGSLTLKGGTITGNEAKDSWGGGVYLYDKNCAFHFDGGAITGNTAGRNGGGLHASENCVCEISGDITIDGNTANGSANNLNLAVGAKLQVTGALAASASIHFKTSEAPEALDNVLVAKAVSGQGSVKNFVSDRSDCFGRLSDSGDLELCVGVFVHFQAGEGSGNMSESVVPVLPGGTLTLPECGYTAPEGKVFNGWQSSSSSGILDAGECIDADDPRVDHVVNFMTAIWTTSPWQTLQQRISAGNGATVRLQSDVTALDSESTLTVPGGVDVTLDLNGHTIDRGLFKRDTGSSKGYNTPRNDGSVITVQSGATLRVIDTSSAQTGRITGGATTASGCAGGVTVKPGGCFKLYSGTITDNYASLFFSAGVECDSSSAFYWYGGAITGNGTGGGSNLPDDWKDYYTHGDAGLSLPKGITEVEEGAFAGANITRLYVPEGCEHIGKRAFYGCKGLKYLFLPRNCTIDSDAFTGASYLWIEAPAGGTAAAWAKAYADKYSNIYFTPE